MKKKLVIVTVSGGIAEVWYESEGVDVHVVDFDEFESDDIIGQAELLSYIDDIWRVLKEENSEYAKRWADILKFTIEAQAHPDAVDMLKEEFKRKDPA